MKQAVERVAPNGVVAVCLPWDALVSDNERHGAAGGKAHSAAYRRALALAIRAIRDQVGTAEATARGLPWAGDVALVVALYLPDRRRRDATNCLKALGDAIERAGLVADDASLVDVRVHRAGVDREHPRAELRLVPLGGPAA